MPLVIYGLGGVHTYTHTHTHTRIHSRTKVIIRNQARRPAAGAPGLKMAELYVVATTMSTRLVMGCHMHVNKIVTRLSQPCQHGCAILFLERFAIINNLGSKHVQPCGKLVDNLVNFVYKLACMHPII